MIDIDVDTAVVLPLNSFPLLDSTDFVTIETALVYNSAGLVINWNFVTTAGVMTINAITATTAGVFDITEPLADKGMYAIEMPASGQTAGSNNDREGFGWFTGVATGILPWSSPLFRFRAVALNNALTNGGDNLDVNQVQLAGTTITAQMLAAWVKFFDKATPTGTINSLPDAVAGATGGLPTTNGTKQTQTVDLTAGQTIAATIADKTGYSLAATGLDLVTAASTFGAAIIAGIWGAATSGMSTVGSIGKKLADWVVGTITANQAVNAAQINGSATAATNLTLSAAVMQAGAVDDTAFPPTTVAFESSIAEATADHYNGRIIIFTSGALRYEACLIEDYALVGGLGHFTVNRGAGITLTEAPADTDTFIII